MHVCTYRLEFGKKDYARILATADWHIGNDGSRVDCIAEKLVLKAKKCNAWIGQGDMMESILPGDKRHAVGSHKTSTTENMKLARKLIERIPGNCVGIHMGNHEYSASAQLGNITKDEICDVVKVPYLGFQSMITLDCPDGNLEWYAGHGARSCIQNADDPLRRELNRRVAVRRFCKQYKAGLKGIGHWHTAVIAPPVAEFKYIHAGNSYTVEEASYETAWHYVLPSMFRSMGVNEDFPSYAERAGYNFNAIGWMEIIINRQAEVMAIEEYDEDGKLRKVVKEGSAIL